MPPEQQRWLDRLRAGNRAFRHGLDPSRLPVARHPGGFALITCMDPRINPQALGIDGFGADGAGRSEVRIIRTIGAVAENRSLLVGLHLAGIREVAVVTHSDCGNCLAKKRAGDLAASLRANLTPEAYARLGAEIGDLGADGLVAYLRAFDDPRRAVADEVTRLRHHPLVPVETILHGLVYDLATAGLELVVDGYAAS